MAFDDSPCWPAVRLAGTWNGFAIPVVTCDVRDQIAAWLDAQPADAECAETVGELRAVEPGPDGLCTLDLGLTFYAVTCAYCGEGGAALDAATAIHNAAEANNPNGPIYYCGATCAASDAANGGAA